MSTDLPTTDADEPDVQPGELSLDELRGLRNRLQREDDAVSFVRRVAQARLDLVQTELERRAGGNELGAVTAVLSQHLTGGPARPPRPPLETDDLNDNDLARELDQICAELHFGRLDELDETELTALSDAIGEFEQRVSADRRRRFDRIDALSAELVRRYRDGEATVDSLLDD